MTDVSRSFTIIVIDDEAHILRLLKQQINKITSWKFKGFTSPADAIHWAERNSFQIALTDYKMPVMNGIELLRKLREKNKDSLNILMTGYGELDIAIDAIRLGVFDFIPKPFNLTYLNMAFERITQHLEMKNQNMFLSELAKSQYGIGEFIGQSEAVLAIRKNIQIFSQSDAPVLITGETGVGKEIVARTIHMNSKRSNQRCLPINCSAFTETLFESELFGHEKGAFTGADHQRTGKLELSNGGTVVFDELCEIPVHIQVKLLRVLQEKEFERVGGNTTIKLNTRFISVTNRVIEEEIASKRFRSDLFYRLNTLRLHIPPLRERKADIELFAPYFLKKFSLIYNKDISTFSDESMDALLDYAWPGNVRQFENTVEYAVLHCEKNKISREHLPGDFSRDAIPLNQHKEVTSKDAEPENVSQNSTLHEAEQEKLRAVRETIYRTLEKNRWNKTKSAKELGLTLRQLIYRIKKCGIED